MTYSKNTTVKWKWGNGEATGTIQEVHKETVQKTIKNNKVTRHGSKDDPAYVILQDDGDEVLKLHSEVEKS